MDMDIFAEKICDAVKVKLGDGIIIIHNSHMEMWGTEELFWLAQGNTPRLFPWEYGTMDEIFREILQEGGEAPPVPEDCMTEKIPMRVLSNSRRTVREWLAGCEGVCLLVVHHTRKLEFEDGFDMISGTNGLLGAADGAYIMHKKKRMDNTAVMNIVGRGGCYALSFCGKLEMEVV